MKKTILSAIIIVFLLVSCNQKNEVATADPSETKATDSTLMSSTYKMMGRQVKRYACPMHYEVKGKWSTPCSKCGMKLTDLVIEETAENQ